MSRDCSDRRFRLCISKRSVLTRIVTRVDLKKNPHEYRVRATSVRISYATGDALVLEIYYVSIEPRDTRLLRLQILIIIHKRNIEIKNYKSVCNSFVLVLYKMT